MVGVPVALLVTVPCVNSIGGSPLASHSLANSACSIAPSLTWYVVDPMLNACASGLELPWAVRKGCSRRWGSGPSAGGATGGGGGVNAAPREVTPPDPPSGPGSGSFDVPFGFGSLVEGLLLRGAGWGF